MSVVAEGAVKVFAPTLMDDGLVIVATLENISGFSLVRVIRRTVKPLVSVRAVLNSISTLSKVYPAAFDPVRKPAAYWVPLVLVADAVVCPILLTSTAADAGEANANTAHAQPNNNRIARTRRVRQVSLTCGVSELAGGGTNLLSSPKRAI
ncbi:MAG: hypothetical protein F4082_03525 [Gammaproteobacteria bacterium]|nr:hypothetical protein [Gammaproteobacteria bacterium]